MQLPAECLMLIVQLVYESYEIDLKGDICTDTTTTSLDNHGGLSLLFSQASPFRSVVSSMRTSLCLNRIPMCGRHGRLHVYYNLVAAHRKGKYIRISPESDVGLDTGLVRQVFSICGPSIDSISFGIVKFNDSTTDGENEKTNMAHSFSSLVLEYCANIKNLLFFQEEKFKPNWIAEKLVFHKFATQLNSLTLGSNFPTKILDLGACSSLRQLRYMGGCSEHLIQLIPSIGGTLEHLRIDRRDSDADWEKLMEVTRKTCDRLHTFCVSNTANLPSLAWNPRYVTFLCSYGDQLICANLNYLAPAALQKVIDSCPMLDIDNCWSFLGLPESPKCVSVLGPRLASLRLFAFNPHANDWPKILAKCTNLRELALFVDLGSRQLPALPRLETFELREVCVSAQYISHLASIFSNLRTMKLQIAPDIQAVSILKPLVESNQFLRDVRITEQVSERQPRLRTHIPCSLQLLRELVEIFSKCEKLDIRLFQTEGEHITNSEVVNICGVLPCRGVEVHIEISPHLFYQQTGKSQW